MLRFTRASSWLAGAGQLTSRASVRPVFVAPAGSALRPANCTPPARISKKQRPQQPRKNDKQDGAQEKKQQEAAKQKQRVKNKRRTEAAKAGFAYRRGGATL